MSPGDPWTLHWNFHKLHATYLIGFTESASSAIINDLQVTGGNRMLLFKSTKYCSGCTYLKLVHNGWATACVSSIFLLQVPLHMHTVVHIINLKDPGQPCKANMSPRVDLWLKTSGSFRQNHSISQTSPTSH